MTTPYGQFTVRGVATGAPAVRRSHSAFSTSNLLQLVFLLNSLFPLSPSPTPPLVNESPSALCFLSSRAWLRAICQHGYESFNRVSFCVPGLIQGLCSQAQVNNWQSTIQLDLKERHSVRYPIFLSHPNWLLADSYWKDM